MTTPGGVPNLPQGALTIDTLASKVQDMSASAMKSRAVDRFPSIMDNSTGLSPASDLTPFGILTSIWSGVNSLVANSDPADIQGPEDLPDLVIEFIEGLPVIGQFVELFEAILGTYDGDDETLLGIQTLFAPIRAIADAVGTVVGGGSLTAFFSQITTATTNFTSLFSGLGVGNIGGFISSLTGTASTASTANTNASTGLASIGTLLTNIFKGITRSSATSATQDDTYVAVSGQADAVVGQASAIQQIAAALGSGTPDADDFERTSTTTLGANWNVQQTGTGVLATPNGHDASSTGTGTGYEFTARKTDKVASTNHQTSSLVLATAFPSYPFFTPLPYGGWLDLWVRMSGFTTFATRTGLRLRIYCAPPYQATYQVDWFNSGTATNLIAATGFSIPGAGAAIDWEVGVGGNMRVYQMRVNGSPVFPSFTDSADRGFGNTGRGFGGQGNRIGITPAVGIPSLKVWTAQG